MTNVYLTGFPWHVTYLWLAASDNGICKLEFERSSTFEEFKSSFGNYTIVEQENIFLKRASRLLQDYFDGKPVEFDIPVVFFQGTPFQQNVWKRVKQIPYGYTKTYGQIAYDMGKPGSVRAVGAANGANPVPILVPCHRVVQSDGKLGGYSGGLDIKDALLRLEGVVV